MRRRIVAGNWKMNTTYAEAMDLVEGLKNALTQEVVGDTGVIITPPALYLSDVVGALVDNEFIAVAAQNVHEKDNGAFTGEISAPMLSSLDVDAIIIGHKYNRPPLTPSSSIVRDIYIHGGDFKRFVPPSVTP